MGDLITVIVPVYNVKEYLEKCINSILNQTYKSFELILIDDGSTDGSGDLCDKLSKTDSRIHVIHKKNGGLSDARNIGIDNAKGTYITFIDSDDYVDVNYLKNLYQIIKISNGDIVISCLNNFYENRKPIDKLNDNTFYILTKEEAYKKMLYQDEIDVNSTARLYNIDIFNKEKRIRFPKRMPYEDFQIIDEVIEKSNLICYTKYNGYFYLQREGSIMYGDMDEKRMTLIEKAAKLLDYIKKNYPLIEQYALRRYIYCNFHLLGRTILNKEFNTKSELLRNNILKYKKEILKNKIYSKKEKVATLVLIPNIKTYRIFWKLYCIFKNKKIGEYSSEKSRNNNATSSL